MGIIFKSLCLNDLGSIGNRYVYFYPLNIEHAKLPSLEKEGAAASADGVVRVLLGLIRANSWFQFLRSLIFDNLTICKK
jgi:hypothetical protein